MRKVTRILTRKEKPCAVTQIGILVIFRTEGAEWGIPELMPNSKCLLLVGG